MTDPALTSCCQSRRYMDPLPCDGVVFARVPRCVKCNAFKGAVNINYSAPKALAAAWNGTSEAQMIDAFAKRMGPMAFTLQGKYIVPVGYTGSVRQQADLNEQEAF